MIAIWVIIIRISPKALHLVNLITGISIDIIKKNSSLGVLALSSIWLMLKTDISNFREASSLFNSDISWHLAIFYLLSIGIIKSGIGLRVAYFITYCFGKTAIGLTYSLLVSQVIIASMIPPLLDRSGSSFYPVVHSLCLISCSDPSDGSEKKIGSFIIKSCFQCSCVLSAMFVGNTAANHLVVSFASELGLTGLNWSTWVYGSILPGLICLLSVPSIIFLIYPPEIRNTSVATIWLVRN
jgi:di/tricarboxylate transporter